MTERRCPQMDSCEMYALFTAGGVLEVWKTNYCTADFERCERYRRAAEGRRVPVNLLPSGQLLRKPAGR